MSSHYEQDYVKLFCHRHGISLMDNMKEVRSRTLSDPRVAAMITDLQQWPGNPLRTHKDFTHPIHKLSFLVELGLTREDPGLDVVYSRILASQSPEGPFQVLIDIPKSFGGPGRPENGWILSDAPLVAYCLLKLNGAVVTKPIRKAIEFIVALSSENGWHCAASPNMGGFRGPGRKADPCPYATLLVLKMLSITPPADYRSAKHIGLECLLSLWQHKKQIRPYLFAMGTDFKKLKLPFVWYDILHVADVLSNYPEAHSDRGFRQMMSIVRGRQARNGYIPESVYLSAKDWDFGQKRQPSEYMNAVVERIEKRLGRL